MEATQTYIARVSVGLNLRLDLYLEDLRLDLYLEDTSTQGNMLYIFYLAID